MEVSKLVDVIRFHSRDLWKPVLTLGEDLVEGFSKVWRGFCELLTDLVNILLPRLLDLVLEIFFRSTPREGLSVPGRIMCPTNSPGTSAQNMADRGKSSQSDFARSPAVPVARPLALLYEERGAKL